MSTFSDWLSTTLDQKGWSNKELARKSGMSPAAVSQVLTGRQKPGVEFCLGVADALQEPPTKVFRLAGLLPKNPDGDEVLEDIVYYYSMMSSRKRAKLRDFARSLSD